MRLQLTRIAALVAIVLAAAPARADDRAEVSTSLFAEQRDGGKGGLTVIHPQADLGVDLGRFVTLDASYAADAVSGATSVIYQADAISSATTFSDTRHEGTLGLGFHGKRSQINFSATVGTERDYLSRQFGGSASIDLPGRNTTVALAYSHSFDLVCDKDNGMATPQEAKALTGADPCDKSGGIFGKDRPGMTLWRGLSIDTAQVTLTQNLSPTMNLQIAGFGQVLEGFQSNPYRRVRIGQNSPQEHIPDTRDRWSLSARLNRFLPGLHAAVHFDARFYDDTWGVIAGDAELGYSQYIGKSLLAQAPRPGLPAARRDVLQGRVLLRDRVDRRRLLHRRSRAVAGAQRDVRRQAHRDHAGRRQAGVGAVRQAPVQRQGRRPDARCPGRRRPRQ